jgi:hypothetical protein
MLKLSGLSNKHSKKSLPKISRRTPTIIDANDFLLEDKFDKIQKENVDNFLTLNKEMKYYEQVGSTSILPKNSPKSNILS